MRFRLVSDSSAHEQWKQLAGVVMRCADRGARPCSAAPRNRGHGCEREVQLMNPGDDCEWVFGTTAPALPAPRLREVQPGQAGELRPLPLTT